MLFKHNKKLSIMRNPHSLFAAVVNYVNTYAVGETYNVSDLCKHTTGIEVVTFWKRTSAGKSYRTRTYQSYLKSAGYIKNVGYGKWEVVKSIPDNLTLHDLHLILGYVYNR